MISEAIDFRFLLLENYKKLKISENEFAVILMMDHFISCGNPFVTADLLSLKMSMEIKEIDKIIANLLTRGFVEYVTQGNKTVTSLNPLKEKLYREFQISLSKEEESRADEKINAQLNNIYENYQKLLGRSLSQVEIAKINEWITFGYTDKQIIDALKDALNQGKKTIRAVDKILLSYSAKEDIQEEGHTPICEGWNKNLEETIRIAKTPWLDQDDEK